MRFELEFEEAFEGDALDPSRWLPHYLPHWSSRAQSAARYEIGGGVDVSSTTHLPPCPSCGNGEYETVTGGDSKDDPYPDRSS